MIDTEDSHDFVWGAVAIGKEINRSPRQTFHLLENGFIPAKKVGKIWLASRRKLREYLETAAA